MIWCGIDYLLDESYILPKYVEQVFFAEDNLDSDWIIVLQNKQRDFVVFETIEPMDWDDDRDIIRLPFGEKERERILGVYEFHQDIEEDNVDDTFEEYESTSDEEDMEMKGVEEFEKVLDETADDFNEEDYDYESRQTRSLFEM